MVKQGLTPAADTSQDNSRTPLPIPRRVSLASTLGLNSEIGRGEGVGRHEVAQVWGKGAQGPWHGRNQAELQGDPELNGVGGRHLECLCKWTGRLADMSDKGTPGI